MSNIELGSRSLSPGAIEELLDEGQPDETIVDHDGHPRFTQELRGILLDRLGGASFDELAREYGYPHKIAVREQLIRAYRIFRFALGRYYILKHKKTLRQQE